MPLLVGTDGLPTLGISPPPPPAPPPPLNCDEAILAIVAAVEIATKANDAIPAGLGAGPIATGAEANEAEIALNPSIVAKPNCKALFILNCFRAKSSSSLEPFLAFEIL